MFSDYPVAGGRRGIRRVGASPLKSVVVVGLLMGACTQAFLEARCERIETASPSVAAGCSTIGWSMSVERPREETAE